MHRRPRPRARPGPGAGAHRRRRAELPRRPRRGQRVPGAGADAVHPRAASTPGSSPRWRTTSRGSVVGDRVFGSAFIGAFAEEIVVGASSLTRIPDDVDDRTAAAFGVTYKTAYHVLRSVATLAAGRRTRSCSAPAAASDRPPCNSASPWGRPSPRSPRRPRSWPRPKSLGATRLIDHRAGDLRAALRQALPEGADVVVDPVGGDLAEPALRALRFDGRFVTVGYASGTIPRIPLNLVLLKGVRVLGFQFRDWATHRGQELARNDAELMDLLAQGKAQPLIGATFDLADDGRRPPAHGRRAGGRQDPAPGGRTGGHDRASRAGPARRARVPVPNIDVDVRVTDECPHVRPRWPGAGGGRDPVSSTQVMEGVRVLEVAEHTFVPAASALLADLGAEIIKIEPTERGDAMRGLASTGVMPITGDVHPLLEHSNRGKRSLALDLTTRRRPRHPLQAGGDLRRLPDQQAAPGAQEAQHRARRRAGPQPQHHLRGRHRAGRARSRRRQGFLRLAVLLVPGRGGPRREAGRRRLDAGPSRSRASATPSEP